MKLPLIFLAALSVMSCQVAEQERRRPGPIASLSNEQLWSIWFQQAAIQELICKRITRHDAVRLLNRRYGAQERRIAARLGEKKAEEIILTLPPCSHFRGATDRYADTLSELENRLATS